MDDGVPTPQAALIPGGANRGGLARPNSWSALESWSDTTSTTLSQTKFPSCSWWAGFQFTSAMAAGKRSGWGARNHGNGQWYLPYALPRYESFWESFWLILFVHAFGLPRRPQVWSAAPMATGKQRSPRSLCLDLCRLRRGAWVSWLSAEPRRWSRALLTACILDQHVGSRSFVRLRPLIQGTCCNPRFRDGGPGARRRLLAVEAESVGSGASPRFDRYGGRRGDFSWMGELTPSGAASSVTKSP